jgi:hypothetical protein
MNFVSRGVSRVLAAQHGMSTPAAARCRLAPTRAAMKPALARTTILASRDATKLADKTVPGNIKIPSVIKSLP